MIGKWLRASLASLIWLMTTKLSGVANIGMRSISTVRSAGREKRCRQYWTSRRQTMEPSDKQDEVIIWGSGTYGPTDRIWDAKTGLSGPELATHASFGGTTEAIEW